MSKEDKKGKEPVQQGLNPWMIATAVLGIAFVVVLALFLQSGGSGSSTNTVPVQTCGMQMVNYINTNFVQPGTQATFRSAEEKDGVYQIITNYQERDITIYATRDCNLLFLDYIDIKNVTPTPTVTTTPTPAPVKSAVPTVDLYVMSFCPYGVQAETSMKPVVDLLGSKANITVRYIAAVQGADINSVSSLHGVNEAKEDARQLCVAAQYQDKFWDYLTMFNTQCYSLGSANGTAVDSCWKTVATSLGINTTTIETCAYGTAGISLLTDDETLVAQYGVTGSPTLIINGQRYAGARTPEAFKQAICNAFVTVPGECATVLSTNTTSSGGQC